jgi:hypothetical protein
MRVTGFITRFNRHRAKFYLPSEKICVDESIFRWYGIGGEWINMGLPMYVAIDRKPDNGCEVQNAADGNTGVMIQLKLVTTAVEQAAVDRENNQQTEGVLHGVKIMKELLLPWANSGRLICADSYYASTRAAIELYEMGLRFIGIVKQATRGYPMSTLSNMELHERGQFEGAIARMGNYNILAFVWMDRTRRYFVATAGSLDNGAPYTRERWRQLTPDAEPVKVELQVQQPKAAEMYYDCCAAIDRHNRCRQDDLMLEKKFITHDWSKRVNLSILGICIVDSWLVFKSCRGGHLCQTLQADFYTDLAEELIDNTFDGRQVRPRPGIIQQDLGPNIAGIGPHLAPTDRKRRKKDGTATPFSLQGRCMECNANGTTYVCSECRITRTDPRKEYFICSARKGTSCFADHCAKVHNL